MKQTSTSPTRLASFGHALRGIRVLFKSQVNARLHLLAATLVIALGWGLQVSATEWLGLVLAMAAVFTAEALNTALELVVDLVSPEWNALARDAKDVAAGAVLLASIGALVVGGLVFLPKCFH